MILGMISGAVFLICLLLILIIAEEDTVGDVVVKVLALIMGLCVFGLLSYSKKDSYDKGYYDGAITVAKMAGWIESEEMEAK